VTRNRTAALYRIAVMDLEDLMSEAQRAGWASGSGHIDAIREHAASLGWAEIPARRGDTPVAVLRLAEPGAAHPRSLSATYGLSQQPLHTDGAHLTDPPDIVVLICSHPSPTATRVWAAAQAAKSRGVALPSPSALTHGMFLVHNGRDSFFAPAPADWDYRYDPGCMTACDARARQVEEYFMGQLAEAATFEWTSAGQVLVVDNRHALHSRAAVADGDMDRELIRVAFRVTAAK
jgi:hypothetical protein